MIPYQELEKLTPSTIIELCELDLTPLGQGVLRFFSDTNMVQGALVWAGNEYTPWPIQMSGFKKDTSGTLPTPTLTVANIDGVISKLLVQYDNLLGMQFTRRRTLLKYLDAVNFPNQVNPTADPSMEFPEDIFFIERKANEDDTQVQFELAASLDLQGMLLPRRQVIANICPWQYRGEGCGYTGTAMFDVNDTPVTDAAKDVCSHRLSSCKLRWTVASAGTDALPFGGFPGAVINMPGNG